MVGMRVMVGEGCNKTTKALLNGLVTLVSPTTSRWVCAASFPEKGCLPGFPANPVASL